MASRPGRNASGGVVSHGGRRVLSHSVPGPAKLSCVSPSRFVPGFDAPERPGDPALLFAVRGFELLVTDGTGPALIPTAARLPALAPEALYLGTLDDQDCYVVALPKDTPAPEGLRFTPARDL